MCEFCNVWVFWQLCVVLVTCLLVFTVFCIVCTVFLYCFVYVYLFLFVTSIRTTATEWKLSCRGKKKKKTGIIPWRYARQNVGTISGPIQYTMWRRRCPICWSVLTWDIQSLQHWNERSYCTLLRRNNKPSCVKRVCDGLSFVIKTCVTGLHKTAGLFVRREIVSIWKF